MWNNSIFTIIVHVRGYREGNLTAGAEYVDEEVLFVKMYTEPIDLNLLKTGRDPSDEQDEDSYNLPNVGEAAAYTWLALTLVVVGLI